MTLLFLVPIIAMLLILSVALFMGMSIHRRRMTLYTHDPGALRSVVCFKPLIYTVGGGASAGEHLADAIARRLRARNLRADLTTMERDHAGEVIRVGVQRSRYTLSLHRLDKRPEAWMIQIEQRFRNGKSAPHDVPDTRALMAAIEEALQNVRVTGVRWHRRQDWEQGHIDRWSRHPCDDAAAS